MARKRKKKKSHPAEDASNSTVPRSFVMHRGEIGKSFLQLEMDLRRVMEPYTALNLKVRKNNVLKDFVNVAGPIGVSHFLILSKTENSTNLRIARLPRGPTLTFQVKEFSLMRDISAIAKKPKSVGRQYNYPPLLVLNHFNNDGQHMKLMTTMLQNMFPSINIQKVQLSEIRRCVLFNFNQETNSIDFRHYNIEAAPAGLSRGVKKIIKNKVPNLGSLTDISEFVTGSCYLSESEGEEPAEAQVTLPQSVPGKGNAKSSQSAIKLTELGPRLTLQLVKIQEGLCDGEVLFHRFVTKTKEERQELKKRKQESRKLKESRKMQQKQNVERKEALKQENKERSLEGMRKKQDTNKDLSGNDVSDDDDTEYYRQEVGEDPDEDLFTTTKSQPMKRKGSFNSRNAKRPKLSDKGRDSRDSKTASNIKNQRPHSKDARNSELSKKGKSSQTKTKKYSKTEKNIGNNKPKSFIKMKKSGTKGRFINRKRDKQRK